MSNDNFLFLVVLVCVFAVVIAMYRLALWSRKMPKGAFLLLSVFPLIAIFPTPPQEIKKIERVKQTQAKKYQESGEPEDNKTESK